MRRTGAILLAAAALAASCGGSPSPELTGSILDAGTAFVQVAAFTPETGAADTLVRSLLDALTVSP